MKTSECKHCKYVVWLIGLGQGVRCNKDENQKFLPEGKLRPVVISQIPSCEFRVEK